MLRMILDRWPAIRAFCITVAIYVLAVEEAWARRNGGAELFPGLSNALAIAFFIAMILIGIGAAWNYFTRSKREATAREEAARRRPLQAQQQQQQRVRRRR